MFEQELYQTFETSAHRFGPKIAIIFGTHHISYQRLLDAVERLANGLANLGISKGDTCVIMLPNLPQFAISYYALLKLGTTAVPVNIDCADEQLQKIFHLLRPKAFIALDRFSSKIETAITDQKTHKIYLGENLPSGSTNLTELIASSEPSVPDTEISGDNTALILFTSGLTASPKGVQLTHGNLRAQVHSVRHALSLNSNDTVLCFLPFFHSFGNIVNLAAPLSSGCTIVLFTSFETDDVLPALNSFSNIVIFGTPKVFENLSDIDNGQIKVQNIRTCICTAGFLSEDIRKELQDKFGQAILNCYGLTEAGPLVCVEDVCYHNGETSVGWPTFGVQVKIVDDENNEITSKDVGEIVIRAPRVMKGYLDDQRSDEVFFSHGWLKTGDLGRVDEVDQLHYLGRKANVILKGGFKVFPNEIENILRKHPKVGRCRVTGVSDSVLGQEVKAFVEPSNGQEISANELTRYCKRQLPVYKCPGYIDIVHALPDLDVNTN
ncbi:AMP-binding protein [candidate division KSB1 bacterium]|nr:AMP-binding protein [candidate division KSB1 bacterium]